MIILFIILVIISIWGVQFSSYNENSLSMDTTNAVKGIFAVVILFSHMNGYIILKDNLFDEAFVSVLMHIGQLMVAPYLFYSGYGILESVKSKQDYSRSFPRKRILKTLVHFDIAVASYLLVDIVIGVYYPFVNYLSCWVGWDSIGNSNWFICVILLLYVLTFFSISLAKRVVNKERSKLMAIPLLVTIMSVVLWVCLYFAGKESWWYDTIITFALGMWFSFCKETFEFTMKHCFLSWVVIVSLSVLLMVWHILIGNDQYGICACLFCLMIASVLTKIKIGNRVLEWLGTSAFAIYIMQRLPMNIYNHFGLNNEAYLFVLISLPSVIFIAWIYGNVLSAVDAKLSL